MTTLVKDESNIDGSHLVTWEVRQCSVIGVEKPLHLRAPISIGKPVLDWWFSPTGTFRPVMLVKEWLQDGKVQGQVLTLEDWRNACGSNNTFALGAEHHRMAVDISRPVEVWVVRDSNRCIDLTLIARTAPKAIVAQRIIHDNFIYVVDLDMGLKLRAETTEKLCTKALESVRDNNLDTAKDQAELAWLIDPYASHRVVALYALLVKLHGEQRCYGILQAYGFPAKMSSIIKDAQEEIDAARIALPIKP